LIPKLRISGKRGGLRNVRSRATMSAACSAKGLGIALAAGRRPDKVTAPASEAQSNGQATQARNSGISGGVLQGPSGDCAAEANVAQDSYIISATVRQRAEKVA